MFPGRCLPKQTMATSTIPFRFFCNEGTKQFIYVHDIPVDLVSRASVAGKDPIYDDYFFKTVALVLKEREQICRNASNSFCDNCGLVADTVLQSAISWLHRVGEPSIGVWVNPVCGKGECEMAIRQLLQDIMRDIGADFQRGAAQTIASNLRHAKFVARR